MTPAVLLGLGIAAVAVWAGCAGGLGGSGATGGASTPTPIFALTQAVATSPTAIEVRFTRAVDPATATDPASWQVDGLPFLGASMTADAAVVRLDTHHQGPWTYSLHASGVRSARGEAPTVANASFVGAGPRLLAQTDNPAPATLADLLARSWTVVDDPGATNSKPSAWAVQGGAIVQTSNIYGGSSGSHPAAERFGTYLIWSGSTPNDVWIEATLQSGDNDGIGLICRYRDARNYYRFEWDRQRRRRRLVKVVASASTVIAADNERYELDRPYRLRLAARGDRIAVFQDGELVLSARDSALASGKTGVYCWGSDDLTVRDVQVEAITTTIAPPSALRFPTRPDAPRATHGVAAADVTESGALLWVRTSEPARVAFELAQTADLSGAQRSAEVLSSASADHAVTVPITGLSPATRYHYRAVLADPADPTRRNVTEIGTFDTAPAASTQSDVVFAVTADFATSVPARLDLMDRVAARRPSFCLNLGDFPYTDASPAATTLEGYREKHRVLRAFGVLRRFFRGVPTWSVWDDHEVRNNWDGATDASRVGLGTRVWKEFFPYRATPGANGGIYRSIRWGAALEIFLLDTRLFRSANSAADGPTKTMLGAAQKAWLLDGLRRSTATFKIVASSVPLRYGTTGNDHWKGFATERTEIFDHILQNGITGVWFLSGDQHWAAVHHHAEGFVEVQACPISAGLRTPPPVRDPHVVFLRKTYCYGIVRVNAAARTCTVELYDSNDTLMHTETIR